ncbi:MAG TPA: S8/S53 family peptidase [Solimonas sp.]|nr:S8/S53 family peptidase [Solimonas sp.]
MSRRRAYCAATTGLVIALAVASDPYASAAAPPGFGGAFTLQQSGWQSPAQGGNGDYVFIDAPAAGSTAEGTVTLSGRAGNSSTDPNGGGGGGTDFSTKPQVVIAMIDTGGNPYHVDFRDETRLVHPSTYLTGFPASAKAAPLCFVDGIGSGPFTYRDDCKTSYMANIADDHANIAVNDLVWYPGTRLMSKSFAHTDVGTPPGFDSGGGDSATSHGSWVSSTAIGKKFGNCPECLLIILEGDTVDAIDAAYDWAAKQPWIDVITSSTSVGIIGAGINPGIFTGNHDAGVIASQNGKIFLVAAGNGAANAGLVPTSTYLYGSSSPTLIPVGASFDDGLASHWSDFPAEIMANGNDRQVAESATMSAETAVGGTSFSSPGAAGVLAQSLLKARIACNDNEEGASGASKTLLRNNGCTVTSGPFANGILTRDELHEAFVKNAVPAYDQLSPVPGPVGWAKNAYGYVDLGNGIGNGGSTIQPAVTASLLGTNPIPVRTLEQFWYDSVVREGQTLVWGARPVVDGDGDAFPRDDAACMPACAPDELQRYADGFSGMSSASSTYQDLFNVLGVSASEFARAAPAGHVRVVQPVHSVGGVVAETGPITISNSATHLTVRLNLAGLLDGLIPTVRSNPVSYEVLFGANHNGVAQEYRLSYEFQAIDFFALLDGTISEPLTDAFAAAVDTLPDASGISGICPITTDLSGSHFDADTTEAVWVIPLSAFSQDNRPIGNTTCPSFTSGGRALQAGDTLTDLTASSVLTVGIVNFGNGLGLFGQSTADDYTLGGTAQTDADGDGVPDGTDQCPNTPAGADVDASGCPLAVAIRVNGQMAGTATVLDGAWSLAVDFSLRAPVNGTYVVEADYGTAADSVTLQAATDSVPDVFAFADRLDAAPSSFVESAAVVPTGYNRTVPVTVTGGQYRIAGGAYTNSTGSIASGQSLQVRMMTASNAATTRDMQVTVGGVTAQFRTRTRAAFTLIDQINVPKGQLTYSQPAKITGVDPSSPISVSNGSYQLNGSGPYVTSGGVASNGDVVRVQHMSASGANATVDTVLSVGSQSDTFSSTTGPADTTPNAFTLVDQTNVAKGQLTTSQPITIRGIDTPTPITVSNGSYQLNGSGPYVTSDGVASNGDVVRVQHMSSTSPNATVDTVLSIGSQSDTFSSTTGPADTTPNAFTLADQANVAKGQLTTSQPITIRGIDTPTPISISNGTYQLNRTGPFVAGNGTVNNNDVVWVQHMSATGANATVSTVLNIGGLTDTFSSTTGPADTTPSAFTLTDQTNVARGQLITSQPITILGIDTPTTITVSNGSYQINRTGPFITGSSTVNNKDVVRVQHMSSSSPNTRVDTLLNVGGVTDTYSTTTGP